MTDADDVANVLHEVLTELGQATYYSGLGRGSAEQSLQGLQIAISKLEEARPFIRSEIQVIDEILQRLGMLFGMRVSESVSKAIANLNRIKQILGQFYDRAGFMLEELNKRRSILEVSRIEQELGEADQLFLEVIDNITDYITHL